MTKALETDHSSGDRALPRSNERPAPLCASGTSVQHARPNPQAWTELLETLVKGLVRLVGHDLEAWAAAAVRGSDLEVAVAVPPI